MISFLKRRKAAVIAVCAGVLYFIFIESTSLYIPCVFRLLTGLCCPGCGVSHMISDIAHLRFADAAAENYCAAGLAVMWALIGIVYLIFRPESLKKNGKLLKFFLIFSVVILIIFGVVRNIPGATFLKPLYLR
ncbi:MAG: DUF2752 domain-containing protein [Clostridia bacterium]|nr:DUF2752 domain-containing protein [Clostridia bacterium]